MLLSRITTVKDVNRILNDVASSGLIETSDKEKLSATLHEIVNHPQAKSFFIEGVKVRKEAEILLENGNVLRPDRVIIDEDHAIVIDYKTGKIRESHAGQLNEYESYLKEMGFKEIRKILLYTEPEVKMLEV